jgi:hypothetical protein
MSPRYRVTLTKEERRELEDITRRGKTHARRFINARALLLCDAASRVRGGTLPMSQQLLGSVAGPLKP